MKYSNGEFKALNITTLTHMTDNLAALPDDPLLGLSALFSADKNPNKVDLGVGVYKDEFGQAPILQSVKHAETFLVNTQETKSYTAPKGDPEFIASIEQLLLGDNHSVIKENRIQTIQTPGGSGALRIAAEFIKRCNPNASIWLSNPTWINHEPLLGRVGLALREYDYYNYQTHTLDFDRMIDSLDQAKPGDVVLLHGCCHNPSGCDLNLEQWQIITDLLLKKQLLPFIDIAYQGIGQSIEEDAAGLRLLSKKIPEVIITSSCSKTFLFTENEPALLALSQTHPKQQIFLSANHWILFAAFTLSHQAMEVTSLKLFLVTKTSRNVGLKM